MIELFLSFRPGEEEVAWPADIQGVKYRREAELDSWERSQKLL